MKQDPKYFKVRIKNTGYPMGVFVLEPDQVDVLAPLITEAQS